MKMYKANNIPPIQNAFIYVDRLNAVSLDFIELIVLYAKQQRNKNRR